MFGHRVRYYLVPFNGTINPVFPSLNLDGATTSRYCTWFCNLTVCYDALKAWTIWCHEAAQVPENLPRNDFKETRFAVQWGKRNCYLHASSEMLTSQCFPLRDQFCYTAGRLDIPSGEDWWEHRSDGDPTLVLLDHVAVSYNMRLATSNALYPWKEPECKTIANDALAGVNRLGLEQIPHTARQPTANSRHILYNDPALNSWGKQVVFPDCLTAPAVNNTTPWFVYVQPHGTSCRFPAQLVYRRVTVLLQASVDRTLGDLGRASQVYKVRTSANFVCLVELGVRLNSSWVDVSCEQPLPPGTNQCGLDFVDPATNLILASDGCSTVPLQVKWHGLLGPRPWSKTQHGFDYVPSCSTGNCRDVLHALDGFLVPGEVNDFLHPDDSQVYDGDVFVALNQRAESFGC